MNLVFTKPPPDGLPMSTAATTYGPSDPTRQSSCASQRTAPPSVKLEIPTGMETVYTVQQLTQAMVQLPRTPEQSPFASMAVAASSPVLKAEGSQQQQLYMADQSCFRAQTVNGNDFQYHALHSPPTNSVYPPLQQACSVHSSSPRSWCSPVAEQHCYPVTTSPIITSFPRGSNNLSFTITQSSCSPSMPPSPYSVISEADIAHHHLPGPCLDTQPSDNNHQYHQAYSYEGSPTMMTAMDGSSLPYNTAGMGGGGSGSFQQPLSPCSSTLGLGQQPSDDDDLLVAGADFSSRRNSKQHEEPYAQLIYRALMTTAPRYAMKLQEIYTWFKENTEKGRDATKGWQNSVRHNLSMNKAFTKRNCKSTKAGAGGGGTSDGAVEPAESGADGDQDDASADGCNNDGSNGSVNDRESKKTTEWVLEPWAISDGVQSTTRYRRGHLTRSTGTSARNNGHHSHIKPHHRITGHRDSQFRIGRDHHHDYDVRSGASRKGMVMTGKPINNAAAASSRNAGKEPAWLRNSVTVPLNLSHYNTLHAQQPVFPGYHLRNVNAAEQDHYSYYMPATTPEPPCSMDINEPVTPEPTSLNISFTNTQKAVQLLQQYPGPTAQNINMIQQYASGGGTGYDDERHWSGSSDDGHCAVVPVDMQLLYNQHQHQQRQPY